MVNARLNIIQSEPPHPRAESGRDGWRPLAVAGLVGFAFVAALLTTRPALAGPDGPGERARGVELDLRLDRPIIRIDGGDEEPSPPRVVPMRRAYVRLRVTAGPAAAATRPAPLNLAIAVDRTGHSDPSVDDAIVTALHETLSSLSANDVVSLVAYSDTVEVLSPAGPPRSAPGVVARLMASRKGVPGDRGANVFGGVAKAAAEVRRHTSRARVSHLILISAQQPGLGPQSPNDLAQFGAALARDGVGLTVIHTGPDSPAIRALAAGAAGTYVATGEEEQLETALNDTLTRLRSIRARDIRVQLSFDGDTPPTRILGSVGEIARTRVVAAWRELRAARTLELITQVDTNRCPPGSHTFAQAELNYFDLQANREVAVLAPLGATCATGDAHESHFDFEVATSVSIALGEEAREAARRALARGDRAEAERVLNVVLAELRDTASAMKHPEIMSVVDDLENELRSLDGLPPGAYRDDR